MYIHKIHVYYMQYNISTLILTKAPAVGHISSLNLSRVAAVLLRETTTSANFPSAHLDKWFKYGSNWRHPWNPSFNPHFLNSWPCKRTVVWDSLGMSGHCHSERLTRTWKSTYKYWKVMVWSLKHRFRFKGCPIAARLDKYELPALCPNCLWKTIWYANKTDTAAHSDSQWKNGQRSLVSWGFLSAMVEGEASSHARHCSFVFNWCNAGTCWKLLKHSETQFQ